MNNIIFVILFLVLCNLVLSLYFLRCFLKRNEVKTEKEELEEVNSINIYRGTDILDTLAGKYGVLVSDLPRDKFLQRRAIIYVLQHMEEYKFTEILEALDYLYGLNS